MEDEEYIDGIETGKSLCQPYIKQLEAELAVLKPLVREIRRGLNAYGYSMPKVYEILNRPDVIAILKE